MTDTEALAALLHAEFITHEMGKGREDDPCDLCHQRAVHLIAAGVSLRPPASLDAAWAEAEAALPRDPNGTAYNTSGGTGLLVHRISAVDYWARWGSIVERGPTPAAALRALAAKLRERTSG